MKRVADPIHGTIALSELEVDVVQTLTFQRLRGVKQLGLANLVFPGADYSRFSHCVGVCHVTHRLVDALRRSVEISAEDEAMYGAAALLHDLGHYPFSHSTERAVEDHYKRSLFEPVGGQHTLLEVDPPKAPLDHEQVGMMLLSEPDGEIPQVLKKHGVDPERIVSIIGHHVDAPTFANLISSDLDADRIDYLMRTAHATGLPYGLVDLDYLLAMICVDDADRLCLDARGMRTAEHLLLARYFDYQQVSYHKTVAAYELLLENVLGQLIDQNHLNLSAERITQEAKDPAVWVEFDDAHLVEVIRRFAHDAEPGEASHKANALLRREGPKIVWSMSTPAEF